ncbi:MAG TPA: PVC-type heme-binding CxxCH protein [Candidatus Limnocylindria bacterium]|nr:PVC-type heme-binding CxxCH protein [Candidatus Limnocylindria bacterium]
MGLARAEPLKAPFDPATVHLDNRLEINLWASEPHVVDPVSLCFDETGAAYVAECRDYPNGVGPNGKVGSTIRRLEDTDGDGIPDKVTIFASGFSFATSVTPWRGGILVSAPPEILYLKDTNGDGVADVRQVRVTGFIRGVSDSLVNGLQFQLDNRIHGANGGSGGTIGPPGDAEEKLDLQGFDFSFDPDSGACERTWVSGGGFGLVFDRWGRPFTTYNINHIQHGYISWRHINLYRGFNPEGMTASISDHEEMAAIYPRSTPQTRPNHPEQAGYFSAAGGMGIIDSPAFPADLQGSILVGDVVGNLVHRDVIHSAGASFIASRAASETNREFLASTDPHFRPVGAQVGPDHALYLLVMQREIIEHPDYIPARVKATANLRAGDDRGRIYRITPKGGLPPARDIAKSLRTSELVNHLADPNPWWRKTAQRLIVERNLLDQAPNLRSLVEHSDSPLARLHALWTLQGLKQLDRAVLATGLKDSEPGVRENALQLAEPFLEDAPELQKAVSQLTYDSHPQVRFQAALALGMFDNTVSTAALQDLLRTEAGSPWIRQAVLSSLSPTALDALLWRYLAENDFRQGSDPSYIEVLRELATLIGAREKDGGDMASRAILKLDISLAERSSAALLEGLADGLSRSHAKPQLLGSARYSLNRLGRSAGPRQTRAVARLARIFDAGPLRGLDEAINRALVSISNTNLDRSIRLEYLDLLEFGAKPTVIPALVQVAITAEKPEIQAQAVRVLARLEDPLVAESLLEHWPELPPGIRPAVIALWIDHRTYHSPLLAALEKNTITVGELNLDLEQRRALLRHGESADRQRAAKFVRDDEYANRKSIIDEWLPKLPASGDTIHGQEVFDELCSRCHRVRSQGHKVGPELDSMANRSVEDVLSNILDPNMAINPGFVAFIAELKTGESETGLLLSQSSEGVTLTQANEEKRFIARKDLKLLRSSGMSLMPEGLEAGHTPKDFRDLIAYIRGE